MIIQGYRDHFLLKLGRPMLLAWAECNTECDRVGFIYNSSAFVGDLLDHHFETFKRGFAARQAATGEKLVWDCKEGCSSCCYINVQVDPLDLMSTLLHAEYALSKEVYIGIQERIRAQAAVTRSLPEAELTFHRAPCPFLVDNKCSVYQHRPIACRTHHSLNVLACGKELAEPRNKQVIIPQIANYLSISIAIQSVVQTALEELGLPFDMLRLVEGLDILLDLGSDGIARWLGGENVFASVSDIGRVTREKRFNTLTQLQQAGT